MTNKCTDEQVMLFAYFIVGLVPGTFSRKNEYSTRHALQTFQQTRGSRMITKDYHYCTTLFKKV